VRCSLEKLGHILVVRQLAASVVVFEGREAVVDAVGSHFDCTHPDRILSAEDILPGTLGPKRRMKLPAEVLALQEGLRALEIATCWISLVL
jgi:hypothetical protein